MKLSMTKLIGAALLAPTCLALASLWVVLQFLSQTDADVHYMQSGSRLWSLSRLIGEYAELAGELEREEDRIQLQELARQFDETVHGLEHGGRTMGDGLPETAAVTDADLAGVRDVWARMRPAIVALGRGDERRSHVQETSREIERLADQLSAESRRLVTDYEAQRHELHDDMLRAIVAVAALCGLFLAGGIWLTSRYGIERKRAELALRESQELLAKVVESLPEGICLIASDRRVVLTNQRGDEYLRLLGSRQGGDLESLGGRDVGSLSAEWEDGVRHDFTDDDSRSFQVAAVPVDLDHGQRGWVVVIRDTTHERVIQERAMEQDRLAAVGQLAAGIAHDFNNRLTVIMNTAELLVMRQEVSPGAADDVREIVNQTERAAQLVRQVLDFSRRTIVQRQRVELVTFLKEADKLLVRALPESLRLTSNYEIGECHVEVDIAQLQEVITNLALNARDAMPEGGELRISLDHMTVPEREPPASPVGPGDWVVLEVADTGCGIEPQHMPHLFEPFYTTKGPGEGTGLGLAQVYGIIKQHGGEIDVASEPGQGTTVRVYLPKEGPSTIDTAPAEPEILRGNGERILLVEDEEFVARTVAAMLQWLNYEVEVVEDGRQALERFEARGDTVDLTITDLVMPEMGGLELLAAIKQMAPEAPVILMTGYAAQLVDKTSGAAAADGFVRKPVNLPVLAAAVRAAIDGG